MARVHPIGSAPQMRSSRGLDYYCPHWDARVPEDRVEDNCIGNLFSLLQPCVDVYQLPTSNKSQATMQA